MRTQIGGIYRFRGHPHNTGLYWTIYEQFADTVRLSGSCDLSHLIGGVYRANAGERKNSRWERLI